MFKLHFLFALLVAASLPGSAALIVGNGSFENPSFTGSNYVLPSGWTLDAGAAFIHPNTAGLVAPNGSQQVALGNVGAFQQISQAIGTLDPTTTYQLSLFVGWRTDDPNPPSVSRSITARLIQGPTELLSLTRTFNPGNGDTLGAYFLLTGAFSTNAIPDTATPVILQLMHTSGVEGIQGFIDNVTIAAPVPEPGTFALALIATLAVAGFHRVIRNDD
jgi:hypothetical protein